MGHTKIPGRWSVLSMHMDGKRMYIVYRKRDRDAIDHAGNRETYGQYTEDRSAAEALADYLNEKEESACRS